MSIRRKSRPKYVTELLGSVNKRLRVLNIKDEGNDLFRFMCDYLSKRGMYRGFNFYYTAKGINGEDMAVLAGSERFEKDEWEYLQIW